MEKQKSNNNTLIPILILASFIAFVGFISFSLYTQVTDVEEVVVLKDANISQLTMDLNTTRNMFNTKKIELIVSNANVNSLTAQLVIANLDKNLFESQLITKTTEFSDLNNNYFDLNNIYLDLNSITFDLNNLYISLDNNYDDALILIDDINGDGRLLYTLFTACYNAAVCVDDSNDCQIEIDECINISDINQNRINIFQ